jgi:hypothetical protein
MPKIGKQKKQGRSKYPGEYKKPTKEGNQRNNKHFIWSLKKCLWEHRGWKKDCEGVQFFAEYIIAKLKDFETMTWQEILDASGGKRCGNGNNHHAISANRLPKAERIEFIKKKYMTDYEEVFSLRLTGQMRLVGIIDDINVFYILWFDRYHAFFPSI